MLSQLRRIKLQILGEFGQFADKHLLRLALNEAEAVALQTEFPQLFFPTLAMEKAKSVHEWERRQEALRQRMAVVRSAHSIQ
jgi:hypothetical protein